MTEKKRYKRPSLDEDENVAGARAERKQCNCMITEHSTLLASIFSCLVFFLSLKALFWAWCSEPVSLYMPLGSSQDLSAVSVVV